jgi:hypothetical protein
VATSLELKPLCIDAAIKTLEAQVGGMVAKPELALRAHFRG